MGVSIAPLCSLEMVIFFPALLVSQLSIIMLFLGEAGLSTLFYLYFTINILLFSHIYHIFFACFLCYSLLPAPSEPNFPRPSLSFPTPIFFHTPILLWIILSLSVSVSATPSPPLRTSVSPSLNSFSLFFYSFFHLFIFYLFIYFSSLFHSFFIPFIIMPPFLPSVLFPYIPFLHHLTGS